MRRLEFSIVLACACTLFLLAGCMREPRETRPADHAHVERSDGAAATVSLTPRAVERLGLETVPVTREAVVRTVRFVGHVVARSGPTVAGTAPGGLVVSSSPAEPPSSASRWVVRLDLGQRELEDLDLEKEAMLLPDRVPVQPQGVFVAGSASSVVFVPSGPATVLLPGQTVELQVPVLGGQGVRAVVPFGALLYDVNGEAWVYTAVGPWTYRRDAVRVAYIDGDRAVLDEAPADGTEIVSVGAIELFGAEFGVGH